MIERIRENQQLNQQLQAEISDYCVGNNMKMACVENPLVQTPTKILSNC